MSPEYYAATAFALGEHGIYNDVGDVLCGAEGLEVLLVEHE
jgi:hypothetical protein